MKNLSFIVAIFDIVFGTYMLSTGNSGGWFLIVAAFCLSLRFLLKEPLDK